MVKKLFVIPLLLTSMVFFIKCTDDPLYQTADDQTSGTTDPVGKKGGGGHTEALVNNLSFPVKATVGFTINQIPYTSFTVPYTGVNTGLSADELAILEGYTWYAQKVTGNVWQAEFSNANASLSVEFIDWGDVIEAVNPKINRPFRLEVTLYDDISDDPMGGYWMAMLAYPSSPQEVQGTNEGQKYDGNWATIASESPALRIQYLNKVPVNETNIFWDSENQLWYGDAVGLSTNITFAPELNVGGKYIYGASAGGWKPTVAGLYRITFYMKDNPSSAIILSGAGIGNYIGNTDGTWGTGESNASTPVVDGNKNISYVDVNVVAGGGGGGR